MTMGDKGLLPDNRAVLFCIASKLPYDQERLMQYGYLQNLQELGVNYVVFNKFLRCISNVILKQNKVNKDEQMTLLKFFTEDLYFDVNVWEECLQEMIQNEVPNIVFDEMKICYNSNIIIDRVFDSKKIYEMSKVNKDLYTELLSYCDEEEPDNIITRRDILKFISEVFGIDLDLKESQSARNSIKTLEDFILEDFTLIGVNDIDKLSFKDLQNSENK